MLNKRSVALGMDRMTKQARSRTMSKIRSKNTAFEKVIFKKISEQGIKFKKHYSGVIGKPDIAVPKKLKAVFIHSDFWHGWQLPRWEKILPNSFWKNKLHKNRLRDKKVLSSLRRKGWRIMVIWQHAFEQDSEKVVKKIVRFLR